MDKSTRESDDTIESVIDVLQQLGLKEYEARCFVGLSRLNTGTAKQLNELTGVPRTRVYDAIRVLETQGLVTVHHSSPKQFRAVPLDAVTETLQDQYDHRVQQLHDDLAAIDIVEETGDPLQGVWTMVGHTAIENRITDLIENASEEVVLVVGDEYLLSEDLVTTLDSIGAGVDVLIGAITPSLEEQVQTAVPDAKSFISGLEWLHGTNTAENKTEFGRLALIDRSAFLVSSFKSDYKEEQAIVGDGAGNGLVVIARRLMAQGLLSSQDPAQ